MRRFFFIGHANFFGGWGSLLSGEADKGIAQVRLATAFWEAAGYRLQRPWELRAEAEFCAMQGRLDDALALIDQALADGRGELLLYRSPHLTFRADLLFRHGAGAEVIEAVYREAIDSARDQAARFYQLVTATHFGRWLDTQGRRDEARAMLAEIYNWFTEGFDTADLKDAKSLLDELSD